MKEIEVAVDGNDINSSLGERILFFSSKFDIDANDKENGKLIIITKDEKNVWRTVAVFNKDCWKRFRIYECEEKRTKKVE